MAICHWLLTLVSYCTNAWEHTNICSLFTPICGILRHCCPWIQTIHIDSLSLCCCLWWYSLVWCPFSLRWLLHIPWQTHWMSNERGGRNGTVNSTFKSDISGLEQRQPTGTAWRVPNRQACLKVMPWDDRLSCYKMQRKGKRLECSVTQRGCLLGKSCTDNDDYRTRKMKTVIVMQ